MTRFWEGEPRQGIFCFETKTLEDQHRGNSEPNSAPVHSPHKIGYFEQNSFKAQVLQLPWVLQYRAMIMRAFTSTTGMLLPPLFNFLRGLYKKFFKMSNFPIRERGDADREKIGNWQSLVSQNRSFCFNRDYLGLKDSVVNNRFLKINITAIPVITAITHNNHTQAFGIIGEEEAIPIVKRTNLNTFRMRSFVKNFHILLTPYSII
jgi:hypothetical protein